MKGIKLLVQWITFIDNTSTGNGREIKVPIKHNAMYFLRK